MGHSMRIELTRVGLLVYLANHYTTRGAPQISDVNIKPGLGRTTNLYCTAILGATLRYKDIEKEQ